MNFKFQWKKKRMSTRQQHSRKKKIKIKGLLLWEHARLTAASANQITFKPFHVIVTSKSNTNYVFFPLSTLVLTLSGNQGAPSQQSSIFPFSSYLHSTCLPRNIYLFFCRNLSARKTQWLSHLKRNTFREKQQQQKAHKYASRITSKLAKKIPSLLHLRMEKQTKMRRWGGNAIKSSKVLFLNLK